MFEKILSSFLTLAIFFILLFGYTKLAGPIPFSINSISTTRSTTFDVTAEGKSSLKPDSARISAGITATGSTTKLAQDQTNIVINKVSMAIKGLGVDPSDIQTANYNIYPNYDYSSGTQRITGYTASTNLTIKVKDINNVNEVIDSATANGANNVSSLGFENSDQNAAENEARKNAVLEAKKKAQVAAEIAGFKLGKIINYSENFGGGIQPLTSRALPAMGGGEATKIEPGSNEVKVTVTLSFEII